MTVHVPENTKPFEDAERISEGDSCAITQACLAQPNLYTAPLARKPGQPFRTATALGDRNCSIDRLRKLRITVARKSVTDCSQSTQKHACFGDTF